MTEEIKMNESTNTIEVIGNLEDRLTLSHENHGEKFYEGKIVVKRLSGAEDRIPVIVPGRIIGIGSKLEGKCVRMTGQVRTHNMVIDGKGRLLVNIFAKTIEEASENANTTNDVHIVGTLCKPPVYRTTPFGRTICDMIIAVNRGFGMHDFIPCIAWGQNADRASKLKTSDKINISGRIQSRSYEKFFEDGTSETRTTYEVSVFILNKDDANV